MQLINKIFIIILLACLGSTIGLSQELPVSFTISGCNMTDGDYVQGVDRNGCPCYENTVNNDIIYASSGSQLGRTWVHSTSSNDGTCSGTINAPSQQMFVTTIQSNCDVTQTLNDGCNPMNISNVQYPSTVPTISQWGLFILTVLFVIVGIVSLNDLTYWQKIN